MEETKGKKKKRKKTNPRCFHARLPALGTAISIGSGSTPSPTLNSEVLAPKPEKVSRDQGDNKNSIQVSWVFCVPSFQVANTECASSYKGIPWRFGSSLMKLEVMESLKCGV